MITIYQLLDEEGNLIDDRHSDLPAWAPTKFAANVVRTEVYQRKGSDHWVILVTLQLTGETTGKKP